MTQAEDIVRSTTRAIAGTVRGVRPLRLRPAPDSLAAAEPVFLAPGGKAPRARRARTWAAPVAAAAAVIALAISLMIVRDAPNGQRVPVAGPATAARQVPRYYLTLSSAKTDTRRGLLILDRFTGTTVSAVAPPKGSTFFGATAAADDRTFVVDTLPFGHVYNPSAPRTWYLLRIVPRHDHLVGAVLRRLPIPKVADVTAIAVSGSGHELAVATGGGKGLGVAVKFAGTGGTTFPPNLPGVLRIYSVATGRLLRTWTTADKAVFGSGPGLGMENNTILSWVDGDRGVAFSSMWTTPKPSEKPRKYTRHMTVRTLDVSASGGDLLADSRVIWAQSSPASSNDNPPGCEFGKNPLTSADGKAIVCVSIRRAPGAPAGAATRTLRWLAYRASALAPTSPGRVLYHVTVAPPAGTSILIDALWAGPSARTVLAQWGLCRGPQPTAVHLGVVRGGRFTPLPRPPAVAIQIPLLFF